MCRVKKNIDVQYCHSLLLDIPWLSDENHETILLEQARAFVPPACCGTPVVGCGGSGDGGKWAGSGG